MTRRFIAGVVCPTCGAVDRIVVEHDSEVRVRRCVECNFRESMSANADVAESAHLSTGRASDDVIRVVVDTDTIRRSD